MILYSIRILCFHKCVSQNKQTNAVQEALCKMHMRYNPRTGGGGGMGVAIAMHGNIFHSICEWPLLQCNGIFERPPS